MPLILQTTANSVVTFVLNRPEKLNALSPDLFVELSARLDDLERDGADVRCVVIAGTGRSFCAGADLQALEQKHSFADPDYRSKVIERIALLPMPVLVSVHGHCYTGGLELALAGDMIIAAETASFCDTHAKLGIVPRWGMSARLTRRLGVSAAKLFSMTCAPASGLEAHRMGLCDLCVPQESLAERTREIATMIASGAPKALAAIKHLYDRSLDSSLTDALRYERDYTREG